MANFFSTLFGGGAEEEAANKNRALLAQYQGDATGALDKTYATGTDALNKSISAYDPLTSLASKYGKAGDLYLDALGVNGADGNARATSSFQTTPGYDLTQQSALEAIDRRRAIGGMYASGNADQDTSNWITQNLYGTQYQPWLQGLQAAGAQGGQYATTAAGGQAGGYTNLANLASQYGQNTANVYGTTTQGNIAANNSQAAGEAAGAKNLLGAGLGLVSAFAGGGAGGGLLSSLGGLFGGSTPTGATAGAYGGGTALGSGTMGGIRYPAF